MFSAKLKPTGEYFDAHTEVGPNQDLSLDASLPIQEHSYYRGHFYPDSYQLPSDEDGGHIGRFSTVREEVMKGSDLEPVSPPSKLAGTRRLGNPASGLDS